MSVSREGLHVDVQLDRSLFCVHLPWRIWLVNRVISTLDMLPSLMPAQDILPSETFSANLEW